MIGKSTLQPIFWEKRYTFNACNIHLTTLLTSPIVFLLYFKNGKINLIELFAIDSEFNDTNTDVNLVESDSQVFTILFRI